jgi:hypothetical protein
MINRYHRYLDIPNYIPSFDPSRWNTDGYSWVQFIKNLTFEDLGNSKIEPWLNSLGIMGDWLTLWYTPPRENGVIHADTIDGEDWAKIIFQYGAKGSTMRWWSSTNVADISTSIKEMIIESNQSEIGKQIAKSGYEEKDRTMDNYQGRVLASRDEDATLLYEAEINIASLTNVGILHSSHNPTDERRFVITIALYDLQTEERILWDDAYQRLSPYIKTPL